VSSPATCSRCGEPIVIVLEWDDKPVIDRLDRIEQQLRRENTENHREREQLMGALENLQAADLAEEGELETFLTDIAGVLDGHSDPAIQAVADSINARVAKMTAADPVVVPPADGSGDGGTDAPPADSGDAPAAE